MILETSWEVCNKMGGIYTVLSSRARVMMEKHNGRVVFIGPKIPARDAAPADFVAECPEYLQDWFDKEAPFLGLEVQVGYWKVPGNPPAVLVDFAPMWEARSVVYYEIWEAYGIDHTKGYGDYDEASLFSIAAAKVMMSLYRHLHQGGERSVAIFNEWQTGNGLLYLKKYCPDLHTMFLTHATTVGRSIAGNNKALYAYMAQYDGDVMARELNVEAKHAVEKAAAHKCDCFATVSKLTAMECKQLLDKEPEAVLPNGFEPDFVPVGQEYIAKRKEARELLLRVAKALTGHEINKNALLMSLSGRYEYRNKGIDLYIEALHKAGHSTELGKEVVAFILVPAWVSAPRADLNYLLQHSEVSNEAPLQHPVITHWLFNMSEDSIMKQLHTFGINNNSGGKLKIIFVPCYLNGADGIFNKSYYDLLIGMDLTIYPSYYEPWGYTPLESIAFGVPTITTNLSGFGLWALDELGKNETLAPEKYPVKIVMRDDFNAAEASSSIADKICCLSRGTCGSPDDFRESALQLSVKAQWSHFYYYYLKAYDFIFEQRVNQSH